jgi:hypothetical protein
LGGPVPPTCLLVGVFGRCVGVFGRCVGDAKTPTGEDASRWHSSAAAVLLTGPLVSASATFSDATDVLSDATDVISDAVDVLSDTAAALSDAADALSGASDALRVATGALREAMGALRVATRIVPDAPRRAPVLFDPPRTRWLSSPVATYITLATIDIPPTSPHDRCRSRREPTMIAKEGQTCAVRSSSGPANSAGVFASTPGVTGRAPVPRSKAADGQPLILGAYASSPVDKNAVARVLASLLLTPKPACSAGAPVLGQVLTSIIAGSAPTAA